MVIFSKAIRIAIPTAVAGLGAYALSDEQNREAIVRKAYAFTGKHSSKSFDEHFPRGVWNENWDFREPLSLVNPKKYDAASEEEKKKMLDDHKPTATRHIFLIRHGQYHLDSETKNLTPLGKEQAELLGKRLAASPIKFDKLIYSTMTRATETANIILKHFPETFPRSSTPLLEEGPPYPPVPAHKQWRPAAPEFYSESARIESAFRKLFHRASPTQKEDSYELVVCHANVIRYFVCRALQFPPEGWLRMSLGNCSLTWVVIRPSGNVSIRSIGDIGHLVPHKVSFT
ncbi:unnamed protein product [Caenorhabditis bovis]|uniref:Serine/threonine-protein phosphatase PGAM5, mitochondrial n=1 Tax=Caenorhabditis bovis TaxID=2654633 RepID=A0A8S1FG73_9PELO|nr:unnamed protein product [Caenorhabditis bovis]